MSLLELQGLLFILQRLLPHLKRQMVVFLLQDLILCLSF
jgi:hypothetical protein